MPYQRKPRFAGSFYPLDKIKLEETIDYLLSRISKIKKSPPKILIVPHAGIDYSGSVAGWGFKQIEGADYYQVILLGVSHYSPFDFAAIFDKGGWETPLGSVFIDEDLSSKIINPQHGIVSQPKIHEPEHSLEVQLPFLQKVLSNFKIVPILLGFISEETKTALVRKIAENLSPNTLLVVSSDLSHYPSDETARRVDQKTINAILSGNPVSFRDTIEELEKTQKIETAACGKAAIEIALLIGQKLGNFSFELIKYANSSETFGDKDRVVGYAAIGAWETL